MISIRKLNLNLFFSSLESSDGIESNEENEEDDPEEPDNNVNRSCRGNSEQSNTSTVDKKHKRLTEFQRLKANCKSDDLEKLRIKCEHLVRDCIAGLLVNLSNDDFKSMEGKKNYNE